MTIDLTKSKGDETPEQLKIRRLIDSRDFWKRNHDDAQKEIERYRRRLYDTAAALQAAESGVSVVQYHRSRLQEELDATKAELAKVKAELAALKAARTTIDIKNH